eukprot:jgi/Tetstr1/455904/TSEL_042685.t1
MSKELWDYGGVGDEDHELEADEGGDGSDGEACGDAGGDDAASEQAGEDAPLGCAYGCAQAGHAGGDLELMVRWRVIAAGISAGFAVAAVPAFIRLQLVVLVPYATVIPQFFAHLRCLAGEAGVAALDWAEEPSKRCVVDNPSRRAGVLGLALLGVSLTGWAGCARAAANVEVLRALERRKQSRESERTGARGLPALAARVGGIRQLLESTLLAADREDAQALRDLLPRLTEEVWQVDTLSDELGALLRCVRPTFERFEGLKMRGAADKLMGTLDRELDVALLRGDVARLAAALDEVAMELDMTLQDPRQMWSFCFSDD